MSNPSWPEQFKARTKKFGIDVIRFCDKLPNRPARKTTKERTPD